MNFLTKNNFPSSNKIILEKATDENNPFDYLIYTQSRVLIGCGKIDFNYLENSYNFLSLISSLNKSSLSKAIYNEVFLFLVTENGVYYCGSNVRNPEGSLESDINSFESFILNEVEHVELKEKDKKKQELKNTQNLKAEIDRLNKELQKKDDEYSLLLQENIKLKDFEKFKVEKENLELKIKTEYVRNTINISQLKEKISTNQFNRLIQRPFYHNKENSKFIQGIERSEGEINEIAISQIEYPNNSIKIRLNYTFWEYNSGGDGYPSMYYPTDRIFFLFIDNNGEMTKDPNPQNKREVYAKIVFNN